MDLIHSLMFILNYHENIDSDTRESTFLHTAKKLD